ncbi:MAG: hypothetical protein ACLSHU_12505 [Oscillospiraceae bacterium]
MELDRQTLIPQEREAGFLLSDPEGMVACLSIDEDTDQFHRELTLLSAREDAQRRLVRMELCTGCGLQENLALL